MRPSASCFAAAVIAPASRFFAASIDSISLAVVARRASASRFAASVSERAALSAAVFFSLLSDSAASRYLRPRDSAVDKIDFAFASAPAVASCAMRELSASNLAACELATRSRCWAVFTKFIAVSVAKISNSSRVSEVISFRERRSASCDSSSRIRSSAPVVAEGAADGSTDVGWSPLKPTHERNPFFAISTLISPQQSPDVLRLARS